MGWYDDPCLLECERVHLDLFCSSGNLVDMVRSRQFLEIIEEDNLVENATKVGAYLLQQLQGLQREFPHLINNVRGKGTWPAPFCSVPMEPLLMTAFQVCFARLTLQPLRWQASLKPLPTTITCSSFHVAHKQSVSGLFLMSKRTTLKWPLGSFAMDLLKSEQRKQRFNKTATTQASLISHWFLTLANSRFKEHYHCYNCLDCLPHHAARTTSAAPTPACPATPLTHLRDW